MIKATKLILIALGTAATLSAAYAADVFPNKPMRIIVPAAAGGGADLITRLLAKRLGDAMGQSVIVENRPGVDGIVGTEFVAHAAPDGYTLLMASSSHAINVALGKKLPYDTIKDLTAVTQVMNQHLLLLVNASVPATTLKDFIDYLKANPGKLNYASSSNGSALPMELFKIMTGTDVQNIPYKGSNPQMLALVGNQVPIAMAASISATPHIKSGKIRALGIGALKRSATLPDIPTIAESGVPGYEAVIWTGLFAPAKTPQPVLQRINDETTKILTSADFNAHVRSLGADVVVSTPEEWNRFVSTEVKKWADVVKAANFKGVD